MDDVVLPYTVELCEAGHGLDLIYNPSEPFILVLAISMRES